MKLAIKWITPTKKKCRASDYMAKILLKILAFVLKVMQFHQSSSVVSHSKSKKKKPDAGSFCWGAKITLDL